MPDHSSASSLPSPRDLLTSMFNSLPQSPPAESDPPNNATINPLKALNATHRSLLVTLHVLFPSLLLQAFDLLDRGLVTRVVQVTPSAPSEGKASAVWPPQTHMHLPMAYQVQGGDGGHVSDELGQNSKAKEVENSFYLVRSAHSRSGTSSRYGNAQGISYIVRLKAWNCSCAAFAFSAFPAAASVLFSPRFEDAASGVADSREKEGETDSRWEFGGLSYDGKANGDGGGVPCCKHLMACVLAERWKGVLGDYVKQMKVGKEEMAGLGVDGGA